MPKESWRLLAARDLPFVAVGDSSLLRVGQLDMMAQGIGFAVPSNTTQWLTTEILAHGRVQRRQLGIVAGGIRLTPAAMREFDLLTDQPIVVTEVVPGSLAAQAGLRDDEIVTSEKIGDISPLVRWLCSTAVSLGRC